MCDIVNKYRKDTGEVMTNIIKRASNIREIVTSIKRKTLIKNTTKIKPKKKISMGILSDLRFERNSTLKWNRGQHNYSETIIVFDYLITLG